MAGVLRPIAKTLAVCAVLLPGIWTGTARAEPEPLKVLARVGPWPVLTRPIAYKGRLWLTNSVKGRNHNSADVYSYDPKSGDLRYERHLFSQDAGAPLVSNGLLFWPFEDSRSSVGWGEVMVTDGARWDTRTIPTAQIFHVHALAEVGGRIIAATSAWRAGLQASEDGGHTWRQLYDHPTPDRRVSRTVDLVTVGDDLYGYMIDARQRRLVKFSGAGVTDVPGWPRNRRMMTWRSFVADCTASSVRPTVLPSGAPMGHAASASTRRGSGGGQAPLHPARAPYGRPARTKTVAILAQRRRRNVAALCAARRWRTLGKRRLCRAALRDRRGR